MGNYSYLIEVINGKETLINYELLKNELDIIEIEYNDCYLYCLTEDNEIKTFEDFSNRINGKKLCGYLTNGTIKKLCKSGLCMSNKYNKKPVMYFEEEGWDRIYYFKFFPGTEKVECGSFAFNFNFEHHENEYYTKNNKIKKDDDEEGYYYADQKRTDYIKNLCEDINTNWDVSMLDYNIDQDFQNKLGVILYLLGIRPEDIRRDPEKYRNLLEKYN